MSSALGIFVSVRAFGLSQRGWLFVQAVVLAIVGLRLVAGNAALGYVAGAVWLLFVRGPAYAAQRQQHHGMAYRFASAARWGRVAAWLHPFDGMGAQSTYLQAQGEVHAGNTSRARELFEKLKTSREFGDLARVELWRLDGDWQRIIDFVEDRPALAASSLATPYLRALGETGQVERMLAHYARLAPLLRQLPMLRLSVLAFCGEPELVRRLMSLALHELPASGRQYWLAVAHQARGEQTAAHQLLQSLLVRGQLVQQARLRLDAPLAPVGRAGLSSAARLILAEMARELDEASSFSGVSAASKLPVATLGLSALFGLVFLLRYLPGWGEVEGLLRAGALVLPPEPTGGVAWRIVSAGAVHYNATHLAMNVFGLWVLGKSLERAWGSVAVLGCVVLSSVGAYTSALLFMPASEENPLYLLGASAGVLGLVGALAVFSAIGYFRQGNRLLGRRFRVAALIVALQLVFDAFTPMVSSFLHIAGVICGAVVALPFSWLYFERRGARHSALRW